MYTSRFNTLNRSMKNLQKMNSAYTEAIKELGRFDFQLNYLRGLAGGLTFLEKIISEQEKEWREYVLRLIEEEIVQSLSIVYPTDGYIVKLSSRILRKKIHIEGIVSSYFTPQMSGDIADTQGRLFQQIVSIATLVSIMEILGVKTLYIDEAFSGASEANAPKINSLLRHYAGRDLNIILIAQNASIAQNLESNVLRLSRTIDNKTEVFSDG